ncbi:MAG TPA: hypothetical protein VMZ31_07625 [Phycisphaerae bacterium]|nr:hypothetical protein [Phycisphaerae bacterium]
MFNHSLVRTTVPALVAGVIGGVASTWVVSGSATSFASTSAPVCPSTTTNQASTTRPAAIAASQFALTDDAGNTLATLAVDAAGQPRLVLRSQCGTSRIELGVFSILSEDPDSAADDKIDPYPFVALYHKDNARVMLHFDGLELQDEKGATRVSLGMGRGGLPALELFGPDGWPLWTAP